jgi:hypothetical protein
MSLADDNVEDATVSRDVPTAEEVADLLDLAPETLEAFVKRVEPRTAAGVLGFGVADPKHMGTVGRWLDAHLAEDDRPETPLEAYEPAGYVHDVEDDRDRALDAAARLTASAWGPPFATPADEAGDWWQEAYECACLAVEGAIVDALLASPGGDRR